MKILYVLDSLGNGGVENIITKMSCFIKSNYNASVYILTPDRSLTQNNKLLSDNGIVVLHPSSSRSLSLINIFSYIKLLKLYNFDIIHIHHLRQQILFSIISLFYSSLYITTEHGVYNKKRRYYIFKYIDKFIYSRYLSIISVSNSTELALKNWISLNVSQSKKYTTIYNGIELSNFNVASSIDRSNFNFTEDDFILISVNRLVYGKDISTILNAMKTLPNKFKFICVGDGPDMNYYVEKCRIMNLSDRVIFLGDRVDVPNLLKTADVYVASTLFEGFSTSVLEAIAAGLPVVGTDISPIVEALDSDSYLFKIGDSVKLSELISRLCYDEASMNNYKEHCVKRSKLFTIEAMSHSHFNLYNQLLKINQ